MGIVKKKLLQQTDKSRLEAQVEKQGKSLKLLVTETKLNTQNNDQFKLEIDSYRAAIQEKLKEPKMAAKAAQIISQMLNKGK